MPQVKEQYLSCPKTFERFKQVLKKIILERRNGMKNQKETSCPETVNESRVKTSNENQG